MKCETRELKHEDRMTSSTINSSVPVHGYGKCSNPHQIPQSSSAVGKTTDICKKFTVIAAVILTASLLTTIRANAEPINEQMAVNAIISEAANQGLDGMTALGEAIRNRGTLRGVCGLQRESFISQQPEWVKRMAQTAWQKSATSNLVDGADHWENVEAFGTPEWARQMTKTAKIKNHTFFKARSRSHAS